MGIFDFFRKKEKNITNQEKPAEEIKQGFYRERVRIPSHIGGLPPEIVTMEGNYENSRREGRWVVKDKDGREGFISYSRGTKHGLEKSLDGAYSLYYYGRLTKAPLEFRQEWNRELRGYRAMIKAGTNIEENSSKLKSLLAEGEEKWIESLVKASWKDETTK